MDWQQRNTKVYDDSAEQLAAYFQGIGSRIDDIEKALELAHVANQASVIELGCGDGRDAAEIIKRVNSYVGIDPSRKLLDIARRNNPDGSFVLSDALTYDYPEGLDIIFAFASLLHVPMDDLAKVFKKAQKALKADGIFYISLKERPTYTEEVKKDEYGERMFYYYNPELIERLAGPDFETVYSARNTIGHTDWFTLSLKKR